jgi:hypothetical protein
VGQRIIGPQIAEKYGIELIMYGENQAEYGNDSSENSKPTMDSKFFSVEDPKSVILGGLPVSEIMQQGSFTLNDFTPYIPSSSQSLNKSKTEVHYLGYYHRWDPQDCFYYAVENTGFQANDRRTEGSYSKYSSIDDKIDPFHYFTTLIKFGLGRASYDAAQEIRNGKITRNEGVDLVKKYDKEFPSRYFTEFLDYISISEEQFYATLDKFRPPHIWKKTNGEWDLKNKIWDQVN